MIFLCFFFWFLVGSFFLAVEAGYYQGQSIAIGTNPSGRMPQIRRVVKGYPLLFNQQETNQSQYGIVSTDLVSTAQQALDTTAWQLGQSSLLSLIVGLAFYLYYAQQVAPSDPAQRKSKKEKPEWQDSRYVDSVDSVSKGVSATAPVVISIIGAASLLTASLNGYTLAGIQLLIITLVAGILVFSFSANLITKRDPGKSTVILNNDVFNTWQLMTSAQFWIFIAGLVLLAVGMISLG
jgi:hypothetical protein